MWRECIDESVCPVIVACGSPASHTDTLLPDPLDHDHHSSRGSRHSAMASLVKSCTWFGLGDRVSRR